MISSPCLLLHQHHQHHLIIIVMSQLLAGAYFSATPVSIQAIINSNLAVAFSVLIWLALDFLWSTKIKATGMCYGVVVGLTSITASAGMKNGCQAYNFDTRKDFPLLTQHGVIVLYIVCPGW